MRRLVVGLGNPGPAYAATRHNVGFRVAENLGRTGTSWYEGCRSRWTEVLVGGVPTVVACPQTYMNRSGEAVVELVDRHQLQIEEVVVVHDDVDLAFGRLKIRTGGGHGGHNGVRSIMETLDTGAFIRLKIGIGRPAPGASVVDHVLGVFGPDALAALPDVITRAAEAVEHILQEGPLQAMNRFHSS